MRATQAVAVTLFVFAARASVAGQMGADARPAEYDVAIARNVMVPMRDGVRLATDVYLPTRAGVIVNQKFPTLLARTPYGKNGSETQATFLAKRGYSVVVQDVRGRFDSEGTFYIYLNEAKDGYDAVEWAAAQKWSTGDVGTWGSSYLAGTQSALAVERPPHLKSMLVIVGTSNYHEDGAGRGGAMYLLHNVAYDFALSSTGKEAANDVAIKTALDTGLKKNLAQWLKAYPYGPNGSPFSIAPSYEKWFQDWMQHPDYDEYWQQNGYTFEKYFDKYPDIPIYFIGGWYDIFLRGTLTSYTSLSKLHKSPTKMLVGPWVHGVGPRASGDVDFGPTAAVDIQNETLRWFDAVLQGRKNGVQSEPPVKIFTMGGGTGERTTGGFMTHGGRWTSVPKWPVAEATPRSYYLHPDGALSEAPPGAAAQPTVYTFDPRNPVPTIGGQIDSGKDLAPNGPFDQRCSPRVFGCTDELPLSARPDVRVFQTPALDRDVEVTGPMSVTLYVSSDARDTDFTAKLVDVYPPTKDYPAGYAMNVADRIVRVRYSKSTEKAELLKPGEVREVTIDLLGTSNVFARGHRIRLDISSSNFPFFDVNPNTGERIGSHTRMQPATNTVFHDREHASRIVLPVVSPTSTPRTTTDDGAAQGQTK